MSWFHDDATLVQILLRELGESDFAEAFESLERTAQVAEKRVAPCSAPADRFGPRLVTHDRLGRRIDRIEYHPSYVEMQQIAYGELGLVAMKYGDRPASQLVAFAHGYLFAQAEASLFCPICMTDGAARVLSKFADPPLRDRLLAKLTARDLSLLGSGAMFLTEKQGGSDVAQTATVARRGADGRYRLWGEKWFCSNVDAGVILALARPEEATATASGTRGLGLFVVEPWLSDGRKNAMRIDRLKDKLGVRSMPTGEVTLDGAEAELVGEVTAGFSYMTEMMNLSRLYNAVTALGVMRRALTEGRAWVESRQAFGRSAAAQPLCMETLADLGAETAAALALVFDGVAALARVDERGGETDTKLLRLLTPLMKYYTGKLAVYVASESMELLGGNGYIEEFVTARLLRDAQVLPIWEGTTNICVLDALRALTKAGGEVVLSTIARRLDRVRSAPLFGLRDAARRQLGALASEIDRFGTSDKEAVEHRARTFCDRLVATYEVAGALAEAERLDDRGEGGRDALIARRIFERRLCGPDVEPVPIDRRRLTVLLGDRPASIRDVLSA